MTTGRNISIRAWHMKRFPFAIYFGGLVSCALVFLVSRSFCSCSFLEAGAWHGVALLLLGLPFVLSMRLRDAGFHPVWGLLPLAGLLVLVWMLFSMAASIGGAPSGISRQGEKLGEYFAIFCIICLGILSLFGVLAPTKIYSEPNKDDQ